MIPTLNFKQVGLIFCDIWQDDSEFKLSFADLVGQYFRSIEETSLRSVVVSEFTSELGIPLERGMRVVVNESMKLKKKPEIMQFCCLSEDSKVLLSDFIDQNKNALASSFVSSASLVSNYI
jgi:hypothetical protein